MKLLADANIEKDLVDWLRASGCDVVWGTELQPGLPDTEIIRLAFNEERIILTYDRDFGDLVFFREYQVSGVILPRFETRLADERLACLQKWWPEIVQLAPGHFLVVTNRRLRVRPLSRLP
jgi:uncharacterized protein with PIN domain